MLLLSLLVIMNIITIKEQLMKGLQKLNVALIELNYLMPLKKVMKMLLTSLKSRISSTKQLTPVTRSSVS